MLGATIKISVEMARHLDHHMGIYAAEAVGTGVGQMVRVSVDYYEFDTPERWRDLHTISRRNPTLFLVKRFVQLKNIVHHFNTCCS